MKKLALLFARCWMPRGAGDLDDPAHIRRDAEAVGREALTRLESTELRGFWVHMDADVLDPSLMPAVDSPDPTGLATDEVDRLLRTLVASPRCAGFQLTIYDPDLDPDARCARLLADLVEHALAT